LLKLFETFCPCPSVKMSYDENEVVSRLEGNLLRDFILRLPGLNPAPSF
jgi:hypothetical protein